MIEYFILFMIYSILGWIIEVIATYTDNHGFVNRGFLIGLYCPIYGASAILMITLLNNFKEPFVIFIMSILICSIAEYLTSYIMETVFKARWWDYSKKKFNINGRICLTNSLFFGIMGLLLITYINPFISSLINDISINTINIIFYILTIIFIIDSIISFCLVFKIKKTANFLKKDNTNEITKKVKELVNNSFLSKRLFRAFPSFDVIKDIEKKLRGRR